MDRFSIDFVNIACGLFVSFVGLIAVLISLLRLKSKDYSLLSFGLFCVIYGVRWLVETPTMVSVIGFPFTASYFHAILTYIVPIPVSAFLLIIFGRGLFDSMIWFFRSTIVYALGAITYDLLFSATLSGSFINPIVVIVWCLGGIVNLIFIKGLPRSEMGVMRAVFVFLFLCVANDNLVNMRLLPWRFYLEHVDVLVLCAGMGYVAVRRFTSTERKLFALEQELTIARRIQYSNLPDHLPSTDDVSIAARYIPMSGVAGDFYDVHVDAIGGIGILIADVSGHGVGAALIGSMLKIAFSSQVDHMADPARVLSEINRILRGKIEASFVTACGLFLDVGHGVLRYANAGHPPPLLWRKANEELLRLSEGGTILGPFPDSSYEQREMKFVPGDRLLLYTDGVVETRDKQGNFYGEDRIETFLKGHSGLPAEDAVDRIIRDVFAWSGRSEGVSLDDDLTVVIADLANGR